jgi:hypothetical protein
MRGNLFNNKDGFPSHHFLMEREVTVLGVRLKRALSTSTHTSGSEAGVGLPSLQAWGKNEDWGVGGMKTCTENWKHHRLYIQRK